MSKNNFFNCFQNIVALRIRYSSKCRALLKSMLNQLQHQRRTTFTQAYRIVLFPDLICKPRVFVSLINSDKTTVRRESPDVN